MRPKRTPEQSEKYIERTLVAETRAMGGKALKFYSTLETGYPDRLVMMPGGKMAWVELKSKGEKPTRLQLLRHEELRGLGFQVFVVEDADEARQIPGRVAHGL